MGKASLKLLQAVIFLIGILAVFVLLRFPLLEGRAEGLDLYSIYSDPFILYAYAASVFFFIGLYQVYKLIKFKSLGLFYSVASARAFKLIRISAIFFGSLVAGAGAYIKLFHHPSDDPSGFLGLCIIAILIASIVAVIATKYINRSLAQE